MLTIDLPNDLYNRLVLLALSTGQSISYFVVEAIMENLNDIEDKYMPWNREGFDEGNHDPTSGCGNQPAMF
ncbi:MAG: hypothetical protein OXU66_14770 [Gammaproteobacteria bacterium]|nr:hypothetical protein [Gammaproteobacteria bacterium]